MDVDRIKEQYCDEGYFVVDDVAHALLDEMEEAALRVVAKARSGEVDLAGMGPDATAIYGIIAPQFGEPVFGQYLCCDEVLRYVEAFFGPAIRMGHALLWAAEGEYDTGWHRDIRYWSFQQPELVSAWLALGDEYPENGGLFVIPGSHQMEFGPGQLDERLFFRADSPENQELIATKRTVELQAGDVLFFDARTLHAASRNRTSETKYSAVFTFRPANNLPVAGTRSSSCELMLPLH